MILHIINTQQYTLYEVNKSDRHPVSQTETHPAAQGIHCLCVCVGNKKGLLWHQHCEKGSVWADISKGSFGQANSLYYCHSTWHATWKGLSWSLSLFLMAFCPLFYNCDQGFGIYKLFCSLLSERNKHDGGSDAMLTMLCHGALEVVRQLFVSFF